MFENLGSLLAISQTTATDIFDTGFLLAFFTSLLFVVGYSALAPWWTHRVGWSVVLLDITLGLVLLPNTLHLLVGMSTTGLFFTWYRCLSLFAMSAVTLWRLVLVKMAQDAMTRDIEAPLHPQEPECVPEPHEESA
jgi:hypothetical protein